MPEERAKDDEPQEPEFEVTHYSVIEVARRLWPMLSHRRWRLVYTVLMVILVGMAMSLTPLFGRHVIDVAIPARSMKVVALTMAAFLVVMSIRMVCWYLSRVVLLRIREELVFQFRSQGHRHLQSLCLRFHEKYPSGFLFDRVFERAICSVGVVFDQVFSVAAIYFAGFVFALVACLFLSPVMTALILLGAVCSVSASRRMAPLIRTRYLQASHAHNWIAGYILDKLRGQKTIKAFSLEDHVQADFDAKVWPVQEKWIAAMKQIVRLGFITEGFGYLLIAAVYVFGSYAVLMWGMTLGTLVAFIGYQSQLISFVTQLTNMYGQFAMASAGFDQLFTVFDTRSTVEERPNVVMPATIEGRITFRDVVFSYGDEPVLTNINVSIPYGQTVALVGRSGSGKSTLANLLMRFYDPDSGAILVDNHDIRDLPAREYRQLFGVVLQEPFLFDDTVLANVRCAKPEATTEDVRDALEQAQAMRFVSRFPDGVNHRCGEGGAQLSGGQKQRIAIARCLLINPRFLLLDEATSALDSEAERLIQKALQSVFEGRTAFVIAHRLSTIRRSHRILVLDEGRLVEEGTFDELLEQKGLFRHLYSIATSTSTKQYKLEEAGFA